MHPDLPGYLAFGTAAALAVRRQLRADAPRWWERRSVFFFLLAAAFLCFQRDALRANFQLWNPDESQLIAGALTLPEHPVFWRDVDGTTHGPLAQYPLLLPAALGARLDYTSARLVGAALTLLLLLALDRTLAAWLNDGAARLCLLPGAAWLIFNQDPELAQYTSELAPSVLLALAAWPAAHLLAGRAFPTWAAFACGLAAAAVPFAKLQALPLAAWLFACTCFFLARTPTPDRPRRLVALLAGAVTAVLLCLGPTILAGAFTDFRIRYLAVNLLGYVADGGAWFNTAWPEPGMLFGFNAFLWPLLVALVLTPIALFRFRLAPPVRVLVFTLGLFFTAVAAIYAPHKPFAHYFLLGAGPLLLLLGALVGPVLAHLHLRAGLSPRQHLAITLLLLLGLTGPTVAHHLAHPGYLRAIVRTRPPLPPELIEAVQRHTVPGDSLAVWGWQPGLYVFSQTLSATPDLIVFWPIVASPWRDYYRTRYLEAFAAHPPALFVDTTGPADFFFFRSGREAGHEYFPALRDLIARDYTLAETVAGARLYVRR